MEQLYIDSASFVSTNKGFVRAEWLTGNLITKDSRLGLQRILFVEKEFVTVKEIVLKNGNTLNLFINNYIDTISGFKKIDFIKENDLIRHSVFSSLNNISQTRINWENVFYKNSLKVKVPSLLDADFAFWLGLICSHAKFSTKDLLFEVKSGKESVIDIFVSLTKKIFDLTPNSIKDGQGRLYYQISSRNLMKFLLIHVGKNRAFRKIPSFILEASVEEQLKFVEGLTFKGNDKGKLTVFSGASKVLIDYISSFLIAIGYQIYIKNNLSGNNKKVMYVIAVSKHKDALKIESPFVDFSNLSLTYKVKVPELIGLLKFKKKNPSYKACMNLVKNKSITCLSHLLENADIVYNDMSYYVEVKSVRVYEKEMVKLFCRTKKGIIVEGIPIKN